MRIRMWCSSDRGLVRENNEDAALAGDRFVRDSSIAGEIEVRGVVPFLVADGMGGHANGEFASETALRELEKGLREFPTSPGKMGSRLEELLLSVHEHLLSMVDGWGDLGTTLCGVLFTENGRIFHVNVGDSRLYRARGRFLRQLSVDHSLRQESGNPSVPGNWLTSVLGGGTRRIKICVKDITRLVKSGDTLLVCSDGLSEYVALEDILVSMRPAVENPADELVAAALAYGGPDNITALVLKLE